MEPSFNFQLPKFKQFVLNLIQQEAQDDVGSLLAKGALKSASCLYALGIEFRNALYDLNWLPSGSISAPVISIGNLTVGGTGKTPMVEWIAQWIMDYGYRVGVLSRGYGQKPAQHPKEINLALPSGINDEGLLLQANLDDVHLIFSSDRLKGAKEALAHLKPPPECFLMDDGFQHRRLKRDLDIILIDSIHPFGRDHLLPRGLLREPIDSLRRADLAILTRTDRVTDSKIEELKSTISRNAPNLPILKCIHQIIGILQCHDGSPIGKGWLRQKRALCFCALGNPEGFRRTAKELGVDIAGFYPYPDHHWYTASDIKFLESEAQRMNAEVILTTQKDAVKFHGRPFPKTPFLCLRVGIKFMDGEDMLIENLKDLFPEQKPKPGKMTPEEIALTISVDGRPEEQSKPWEKSSWDDKKKYVSIT